MESQEGLVGILVGTTLLYHALVILTLVESHKGRPMHIIESVLLDAHLSKHWGASQVRKGGMGISGVEILFLRGSLGQGGLVLTGGASPLIYKK